jgi:hypothetical protein
MSVLEILFFFLYRRLVRFHNVNTLATKNVTLIAERPFLLDESWVDGWLVGWLVVINQQTTINKQPNDRTIEQSNNQPTNPISTQTPVLKSGL